MDRNIKNESAGLTKFCKNHIGNQDGMALIAALLLMVVLAALGVSIVYYSSTDIKIARNMTTSSQAFMVSEAGAADGINYLRTDQDWGPDLDKDGDTADDAVQWAAQSEGTLQFGNSSGSYTIEVYDAGGSFGRQDNSARSDKYTTLGTNDVLMEVSGGVEGITRKIGVVVRSKVGAFDYALFSEGTIEADGAGANPGKFIGKLYSKDEINLQGNYDLTLADAQSTGVITPDCSSGDFSTCDAAVEQIEAPVLDFAYYQDQSNFSDQQVFILTPTVTGSSTGCGSDCQTWTTPFAMQTLGTSYTYQSVIRAVDTGGGTWVNNHYWCDDSAWAPSLPANDTDAIDLCPDGNAPQTWQITSDKAEDSKPFMNAFQFNAYTAPSGSNTSSIVNIFDATSHLEFIAPPAGQTATVTATMLVGTASDNSSPIGKIDFEGGAGTLNLVPANGLAVVAETVKFVAKYSNETINVGTPESGAIIVASAELVVEGKDGNAMDLTVNGTAVVGGDNLSGDDDDEDDALIEVTGDTYINFNFVEVDDHPAGWLDYGTMLFERREWREL